MDVMDRICMAVIYVIMCGAQVETPSFTINSSVDATIKRPVLVEFNVSTPWDTDTYYELAVAGTVVAGQPQLKVCSVIVNFEGLNVPCFEPGDQQFIMTTGNEPYDKLVWDLKRIRNAALRFTFTTVVFR